MEADVLLGVLQSAAFHVPLLVIWVVAFVLAITRRRHHPRASKLVVVSMILFVVMALISIPVNALVPRLLVESGDHDAIEVFFMVKGVLFTLVEIAAWVLLLVALFAGRREEEARQ
jgi:hypothetical protein